jgi:hypothetical protein
MSARRPADLLLGLAQRRPSVHRQPARGGLGRVRVVAPPPRAAHLGINPIVTLEKQLLNMIGNLL